MGAVWLPFLLPLGCSQTTQEIVSIKPMEKQHSLLSCKWRVGWHKCSDSEDKLYIVSLLWNECLQNNHKTKNHKLVQITNGINKNLSFWDWNFVCPDFSSNYYTKKYIILKVFTHLFETVQLYCKEKNRSKMFAHTKKAQVSNTE